MPELRWSPEQAAAITEARHALLVANAGTGKTATVVGKIRWLLGLALEPARAADGTLFGGEAPLPACPDPCTLREIAAITFTEKAAADLKRKLREAIEGSERAAELRWHIDRASIGTIHSFCGELLREHALRLNIDPTFRVLDERESWTAQDDVIAAVIRDALLEEHEGASLLLQRGKFIGSEFQGGVVDQVREAMRDLRWHRNRYEPWMHGEHLDEQAVRRLAGEWNEELDTQALRHAEALVSLAHRALGRWNEYLAAENARDFDALILDARALLSGPEAAAALAGIRSRYRILIIDEFQDTDGAQRDIAFAIAGLGAGLGTGATSTASTASPASTVSPRPQLFLVGDPKQSIYRFRGADISVWNQVQEVVGQHGKVLTLSENYRCAPPIVNFVNAACESAMDEVGEALEPELPASRIPYATLVAGLGESRTARLEWLVAEKEGGKEGEPDRELEAAHVAARIREMVGHETVTDADGTVRKLQRSDIAILYRSRSALPDLEAALSRHGVHYYIAGAPHLGKRQEILDLLNVLRLLRNLHDDYRAFGFLRSPFVALRDEVIAHIALHGKGRSLLLKCRAYLHGEVREGSDAAWFDGPEGPALSAIERRALARALDTLAAARDLVHRVPLDEVLGFVLDALGYRLHLIVRGTAEEPLANLRAFLQFTEQYRHLDLATFLQVWERWDANDNGLPQAPLYSKDDDVVTLTTIHRAKGLEWPVVFLVGTGAKDSDKATGSYWSDAELGPVLCPKQDERGARTWRLWQRDQAEGRAEEARLLYVAATRARDRLVVVGPRNRDKTYSAWLARGVSAAPFHMRDAEPEPSPAPAGPRPSLPWLAHLRLAPAPPLLGPAPEPAPRFVVSATELMGKAKDPRTWALRYRHGVQPSWEFAPEQGVPLPEGTEDRQASEGRRIPATVRGTLIHGVLERIHDEAELSRLLHETIGDLDDPDLEQALSDTEYREKLEDEIRSVVRSPEWAWYIQGEHYRELPFIHFAQARQWRVGAFDLYRPGPPAWVIDFKTHEITADQVERVAKEYDIQVQVYCEAANVRVKAGVRLHFTGPNRVIEGIGKVGAR